jgi:hypothetical protein
MSPKVGAGFTPAVRTALFKHFHCLETNRCPFKNLPEARRVQWGEGLTAAEMDKCRWLRPRLVATIDYQERTGANHLRHAMFAGLTMNFGCLEPHILSGRIRPVAFRRSTISQCHAHLGRDSLSKCNSAEPEELLG